MANAANAVKGTSARYGLAYPKQISVGCRTYKISTDPNVHLEFEQETKSDLYGITDHRAGLISLQTNDIDLDLQRETLLHEVLHCILDQAHSQCMLDGKKEEWVVGAIGKGLLQVLKNNKGLIDVIFGGTF